MRKNIAIIIFVFLLGILYPVHAQEMKKPKSEKTASALSLGATVIPCLPSIIIRRGGESPWDVIQFCVITTAIIVGPSIGHFYAGQRERGLKSAGLRLGLGLLEIYTLSNSFETRGLETEFNIFPLLAGSALGIGLITSAIIDIVTAPASARKYNSSIRNRGNIYFVPEIDLKEDSYGLSLVYCF